MDAPIRRLRKAGEISLAEAQISSTCVWELRLPKFFELFDCSR